MKTTIDVISIVLLCNAAAAFFTAFFFQMVLILRLFRDSNPGIGIGDPQSMHANLSRFTAGQIYPDLQPKWSKAVVWVVVSFLALFLFTGLTEFGLARE